MPEAKAQAIKIALSDSQTVSGLLLRPERATALYVLAHGAGAGMRHAFMEAIAAGLAVRQIATLRYQFPYMERGSKRVDRPPLAHAAVRAAVDAAGRLAPDLPLFAGGMSFGGRMTSQAQALAPLLGVWGLVFLSFPLHPAGKPSTDRAAHIGEVQVPVLFLQGTRDDLADMDLLVPVIEQLGGRAALSTIEGASHSFHVPVRSGRTDAQVLDTVLDTMVAWMRERAPRPKA